MSSKGVLLLSICLAALVLPLDFSGVAIATNSIGRDLNAGPVALNWVVNAFMLSFGSLLMGAGALADEVGRKKIFALGLTLFCLTSLVIGFSTSIGLFNILRAIQGAAAAATLASGTAALAQEFEGNSRARAFGLLGTTFGLGLAFGPTIAGVLIEAFTWRSIFITSTLIGLVALLFGLPRMKESRNPDAHGLDWPGLATFTLTLALFTFGVIEAPSAGWTSLHVILLFAGSLIFFVAFMVIESRVSHPMLDISLFKYPKFIGVQFLPIATCYSYVVLLVILPTRFIGIEGKSEFSAGMMMIALSACMLFIPMLVAELSKRVSAGAISSVGLLIAASGLLWLSRVPSGADTASFLFPMLMIGLGASMPWGLMDGLSVSVVPKERAGMAAGIFSTTRVAGEGIALAVTRALLIVIAQNKILQAKSADFSDSAISKAGEYLAEGNLTKAQKLLLLSEPQHLLSIYGSSFQILLYVLSAITFGSAIIIFLCLQREHTSNTDSI